MEQNKIDEFIELYKHLELLIRDLPYSRGIPCVISDKESAVGWLLYDEYGEKLNILSQKERNEIEYCLRVRNILQHGKRIGESYCVIPTDDMLITLKNVIFRLEERMQRAFSLGIDAKSVISASMSDRIVPKLKVMRDKSYTCIPILKDGCVVGVFSETTLLKCLLDNGMSSFSKEAVFSDIEEYLLIKNLKPEEFPFISQNKTAQEVSKQFRESLRRQERIEIMFVTLGGGKREPLRRIITAWDMAAYF